MQYLCNGYVIVVAFLSKISWKISVNLEYGSFRVFHPVIFLYLTEYFFIKTFVASICNYFMANFDEKKKKEISLKPFMTVT